MSQSDMKWIFYNPNPYGNNTGDCVIRALTLAFGKNWDDVYSMLAEFGFENKLMPSSNENWPALLRKSGFTRYIIPNECPDCYTVRDFCRDHPQGLYVLATGTHVITVIDGDYYDSWDSGNKIPLYYFKKEGK
ncbi:MAG: hypothetical protein J6Y02_20695 [Pseudobutyrivibrio sp.]|nr:hypothetical protein [Pseudobutyrivibrio sp.]